MDERAILWISAALYLCAFAYGMAILAKSRRYSRVAMVSLMSIGFALQTLSLYMRGMERGGCPVGNAFEVVQFIAWSLALLYLAIGPAFRMSMLGLFASAATSAMTIISLAMPSWDGPRVKAFEADPLIEAHASLSLFSYGVFALLALVSAMLLLQIHGLKRKRHMGLYGLLPSIVKLERMSARLLLIGVAVFTVAAAAGTARHIMEPGGVTLLKLAAANALWLGWTLALAFRLTNKLTVGRLAWACMALFAASLLALWPIESSRAAGETTPPAKQAH